VRSTSAQSQKDLVKSAVDLLSDSLLTRQVTKERMDLILACIVKSCGITFPQGNAASEFAAGLIGGAKAGVSSIIDKISTWLQAASKKLVDNLFSTFLERTKALAVKYSVAMLIILCSILLLVFRFSIEEGILRSVLLAVVGVLLATLTIGGVSLDLVTRCFWSMPSFTQEMQEAKWRLSENKYPYARITPVKPNSRRPAFSFSSDSDTTMDEVLDQISEVTHTMSMDSQLRPFAFSSLDLDEEDQEAPNALPAHVNGFRYTVAQDARNWMVQFSAMLGGILDLKKFSMVAKFTSDCLNMGRGIKTLFHFIIGLLPAAAQDWMLTCSPHLAINLLFEQSSWKYYRQHLDKMIVSLKDPTPSVCNRARSLFHEAESYVRRHCGEGWAAHCEHHLTQFRTELANAEAKQKALLHGKTPLVVQLSGDPGIGKTHALNTLNNALTYVFTGSNQPGKVYTRGSGLHWEGVGDAEVVTYPMFREASDTSAEQQIDELMGLCNPGGFVPPAAAIEKKDRMYAFGAVTLTSNTVYHVNMPNMQRDTQVESLNRRIENKWWIGVNYAYLPADVRSPAQIRAFITNLAETNPDEAAKCPHLACYPLKVLCPNNARVATYNRGENLEELIDDTVYRKYAEFNLGVITRGTPFSFTQMLRYIMQLAKIRSGREQHVASGMLNFVNSIGDDFLAQRPIERIAAAPAPQAPLPLAGPQLLQALEAGRVTILDAPPLPEKDRPWFKAIVGVGIAVGILGSIAAALATYYYYQRDQRFSEAQYGGRQRKMQTERRHERLQRVVDNERQTMPQGVVEDTEFDRKLRRHVVTLVNVKTNHRLCGFLLNGQHVITNRHILKTAEGIVDADLKMTVYNENDDVENSAIILTGVTYPIRANKRTIIDLNPSNAGDDLICIAFDQPIPGIRDIRGYFLKEEEKNVKTLSQDNLTLYTPTSSVSGPFEGMITKLNFNNIPGYSAIDTFYYAARTGDGECGAPIVAKIAGSMRILGIHCGNCGTFADGLFVTREKLNLVPKARFRQFDFKETVSQGFVNAASVADNSTGKLPEGNFLSYGHFTAPIATNSRTQLRKTPFHDREQPSLLLSEPCRVMPAILDSRKIWEQEKKYGIMRELIPDQDLAFAEKVSDLWYPLPSEPLHEYTLIEAINSIPSDASVGFGWKCRRKDLLIWNEGAQIYEPHSDLKNSVMRLFNQASTGEYPMCVITPCTKDETLSLEKVLIKGKVRTFQISPIEVLVFGTMVMGDWMDYIHANPITTPSTVGIDPASLEWHKIFLPLMQRVYENEGALVDLDYEAMEATELWQIFQSFQRHLTRYYRDEKQPSWHRRNCYLLMMCQSLMAVGNTCYLRIQGNPSGMKGTSDFNTYCAGIFAASAFKGIFPKSFPRDFIETVDAKFNGDDTVLSVDKSIKNDYNFFTIRDYLASLNIKITPAQKNAEPQPFIDQKVVQFCKKQILYSNELKAFVPFVTYQTLLDQLSFARDVTAEGLLQIVNSALQWSFFTGNQKQNGQIPDSEPRFFEQRKAFCSLLSSRLLDRVVTYEELLDRYRTPRSLYLPSHQEAIVRNTHAQSATSDPIDWHCYLCNSCHQGPCDVDPVDDVTAELLFATKCQPRILIPNWEVPLTQADLLLMREMVLSPEMLNQLKPELRPNLPLLNIESVRNLLKTLDLPAVYLLDAFTKAKSDRDPTQPQPTIDVLLADLEFRTLASTAMPMNISLIRRTVDALSCVNEIRMRKQLSLNLSLQLLEVYTLILARQPLLSQRLQDSQLILEACSQLRFRTPLEPQDVLLWHSLVQLHLVLFLHDMVNFWTQLSIPKKSFVSSMTMVLEQLVMVLMNSSSMKMNFLWIFGYATLLSSNTEPCPAPLTPEHSSSLCEWLRRMLTPGALQMFLPQLDLNTSTPNLLSGAEDSITPSSFLDPVKLPAVLPPPMFMDFPVIPQP